MGIMEILFTPNGRIQAPQFWRGLIVLMGVGVVTQIASAYVSGGLGIILSVLGVAIVYPYICVFGKRLHDSNKTAWLYLLFLIGFFVLAMIFNAVLMPLYPGAAEAAAEGEVQMTELLESGEFSFAAMMEIAADQARRTLAPSIILTLLAQFAVGFIAARLYSFPEPNQYGPPVGGYVGDDDDVFS